MKRWPIYTDEQQEVTSVQYVFGLTGGELSDEPWGSYAYNYEGAPEYDEEHHNDYDHEYRTVLVFGGGFLIPPAKTIEVPEDDDTRSTWELVATHMSSGETDCPICGHGSDASIFAAGFLEVYGYGPAETDECGLCECKVKDAPGYVYISDGYEAVYRRQELEA